MILHKPDPAQGPDRPRVRTYLPDNLDLVPVLPAKWRDYGRFVVGGLYLRRHLEKQRGEYDFRRLRSAELKEVLPKRDYKDILDRLRDGGVIEPLLNADGRESYRAGWRSKAYRLTEVYHDARFRGEWLTHTELVRKVQGLRARDEARVTADIHRYLRGMLDRVEVAVDFPKIHLPLMCLHDRQFFFTVCRMGRVHTPLTNLAGSMRKFIRVGGRPLWQVDVVNSQPLLMSLTLANPSLEADQHFAAYRESVLSVTSCRSCGQVEQAFGGRLDFPLGHAGA